MNILPKKRWHVRTKDNIARVRNDEAEAAQNQQKIQNQINKAEQEARINYLRTTCDGKTESDPCFQNSSLDILSIANSTSFSNKDYEKEQRLEKERYEKQIGYLTYVGQHRNQLNLKRWYEIAPQRLKDNKSYIEKCVINKSNKAENVKNNISKKKQIEKNLQKQVLKSNCKNTDKISLKDLRKKRLIREASERKREQTVLNK